MAKHALDILIPTIDRLDSLIAAMTGVAMQEIEAPRVVVADQSARAAASSAVVRTLHRIIEAHGGEVEWHYRPPSKGIAEQRDFLLGRAEAPAVLFLDDDVVMEPWVAQHLVDVLNAHACGFVGAFPAGLSFREDLRPAQQRIEYWEGRVQPESIGPASPEWRRADLHRAANQWHVGRSVPRGVVRLYKVAWVASCVLYDREKLLAVGGFSFWRRLPRHHSGEDVLVQNLLMRRWGGCAILPSGTYHAEVPSTVLNDRGTVDGHALELLDEMAAALDAGTASKAGPAAREREPLVGAAPEAVGPGTAPRRSV